MYCISKYLLDWTHGNTVLNGMLRDCYRYNESEQDIYCLTGLYELQRRSGVDADTFCERYCQKC